MLFKDILNKKAQLLVPEFDRLFEDVVKNQTHEGDLLLVRINGFYDPEVHNWNTDKKMSPYLIGPNKEGHSEGLHYEFIHDYRTQNLLDQTHEDYLQQLIWDPAKKAERDALITKEEKSIQLEMLIYLKIWEADMFIKKYYQILRLVNGEPYDWHFQIKESNRDKNGTGNRDKIIRELTRDRLKDKYPEIYNAFKNAFRTQLRNSIAHSKYSFLSRNIHPNNYIKGDPAAQIRNIPFDEWIDLFHDTMMLYNESIRFMNRAGELYSKAAQNNNLLFPIRVTRKDPEEKTEFELLSHRIQFNDWNWHRNDV
ncbi:MAG: hypothetical protein JWP12_2459 [Bacteroidetes bacterium]|nr:hypothetical protein [Bacteroidota bacterium]